MILRNIGSDQTYHVQRSIGQQLIDAGVAFEVEPKAPVNPATSALQFAARHGVREGDFEHPPTIYYVCGKCGLKGHQESQKGTAHQTAIVRHCGLTETVPQDVAETYQRLFANWKSKSRKLAGKPTVSAFTTNPRNLPIGTHTFKLR